MSSDKHTHPTIPSVVDREKTRLLPGNDWDGGNNKEEKINVRSIYETAA